MSSHLSPRVQVTFDCAEPVALARFWAEVLGYPPPDVEGFRERLRAAGEPEENLDNWALIRADDAQGPAVFFQRVPESKVVKNRVHLDVRRGTGSREQIDAEADRLVGLGARRLREVVDGAGYFVVLADPEGNEFCVD